jgi:hypothetical protein
MSYIVAFVSFADSDKEFPVQCFRTDLKPEDEVIVRKADGELRSAKVIRLQYLNWDCKGRIECKKSESGLDKKGEFILPKGAPLLFGLSTPEAFIKALRAEGWIPVKSRQRMYKTVLANVNFGHVAYIFIRKNGLDIRLFCRTDNEYIKPYSLFDKSPSEGREVRHFLAHTTFNLYEGVLRFSTSFLKNEGDLDRYFAPQGSVDKRTDELKEKARVRNKSRNEMLAIYEACSDGNGGPAYLGDGVWITAGGRTHDWGR